MNVDQTYEMKSFEINGDKPRTSLAIEKQISHIKRYCCYSEDKVTRGIDPTFKFGDFLSTSMCFCHPDFENKSNRKFYN